VGLEVIGAICGTVVFKEIMTFYTAFIIIQEFAFGIEEFRTLFSGNGSRGSCSGTVVVWSLLRGVIIRVVFTA
jgi:hypothetical protein